ncbi:glycoside hydrolase family 3 protein [Arthrobacter sp. ISL-85]|nr:glycoside hydrolase family 3 protein [Arthrobacter sp. ISL-85]
MRYSEQVYPGNEQQLHLRPFEAAFDAGVTQLMTYYAKPVGTPWEEVGFAFNKSVVKDLLRSHYRFEGIVMTDWNVIDSATVGDITFGPNAFGLEHMTPSERLKIAVELGVDQFGGDICTELVVELVRSGQLTVTRIDQSVRRLLLEKFRLGLFESRFVDIEAAKAVGSDVELQRKGREAQAAALTLLSNPEQLLPIKPGARVYTEGLNLGDSWDGFVQVKAPEEADVILVRLDAPWEADPDSVLGDFFHGGSLEFAPDTVDRLRKLSTHAPVIASVFLERPAILAPLLPHVKVLVGDFGIADTVLADALSGAQQLTGQLPFDIPETMKAVEESREDVPFDTAQPLFTHGHSASMAATPSV